MQGRDAVRVALVGYGLGGSVFHAPLISASPGLSLDAIVTSDPGRRAAAGRRHQGVRIFGTFEELLERAGEFDLAVVSVPNALHVRVAEQALRAGLSAVVDKPVAPTAREVRALGRVAAECGQQVIPYHNRRWDGDFRTVAALIAGHRLGEVWRFESRFERWKPAPAPARTSSWKEDPSQPGGGVLYDLGSHLIDQVLVLFGAPMAVYAELIGRKGPLDDDAFVALTYSNRLVVHLWASTSAAQVGSRFRVLGSASGYVKFGLDPQEAALRGGRLPSEAEWGREPPEAWGHLGPESSFESVPTLPGAYQEFYAGVVACLLHGARPPVPLEDAAVGLEVIEAARTSAASATVVPIR
jgi:predicted dehydrogenase